MKKSLSGVLLAVACCGTALAAGTLTVCTDAAPEGFDVVQYELAATNDAAGLPLYDTLLRFKPGGTELLPGLAETWTVSPDGLVYTLKLRRGVKFHSTPWFKPTRELNADDVLWSINRMFDKAHPAHASARNGYVYWAGMEMGKLIARVEKLDAMTVRFTLTRPNAPFLASLSIPNIGAVYPAEYGEQLLKAGKLDQLNTQPVGSGPFVFRSYQKDAQVRYDAHLEHWAGRPVVDRMVFAVTVDGDVRAQRLKAGECLVGGAMKPQSVAAFDPAGEVQIVRNTPLGTNYLALNVKRKALADVRLRRALWMAIDKKTTNRLLPSGRVSLHTVWQWSTMLYALALLPMWFIPSTPPTGIASAAQPAALPTLLQAHAVPVLYLLGALFTLVYSIPALGRTKRYAIRSNLTIAVPRGLLLPVAAWGLVGPLDVAEPWVLGAVFLCFLTGAVSTKDYADMEGDRKGGCRTLPVRYGVYRSVKMISPCLVLPWLVFAAGTWIHDPTDATGTHMLLSGHPRVLQALGFGLALWGLWTLRVIWRNPQALTTRENHPSWLHMYGMLMTAQVGLLVAYLVA